MTRFLIVFGLAVLVFEYHTPVALPALLVVAGGAAFGGAVAYKLFTEATDAG